MARVSRRRGGRRRGRRSARSSSRPPAWLKPLLVAVLGALVLAVWAGMRHAPLIEDSAASRPPPSSPPVVYEDMRRLSALRVLDAARRLERGKKSAREQARERERARKGGAPATAGMALILDDVGYDLAALKRALALPWPVAVSVLPDAPHAVRAARMAHAAGRLVMLHLPMEPANPKYRARMDAGFLRADMSRDEVRRIVLADLARIPFVAGINNHMGSRLTTMERPMRWVMEICREKGLFFVDSRTTKDSVAARMAREAGVAWGERRVFLDDSVAPEALAAAWEAARVRLKRRQPVIVIAHPHPETLDFLEAHAGDLAGGVLPLPRLLAPGIGLDATAWREGSHERHAVN